MLHSERISSPKVIVKARAGAVLIVLIVGLSLPALRSAARITNDDIADLGRTSDAETSIAEAPPSIWKILGRMILALGAVTALIAGVSYLAKRFLPSHVAGPRSGAIQIIAMRSIGQRRNLMLVRASDKTILLGATPNGITFLSDIDHGAPAWEDAAIQAGLRELVPGKEVSAP